MLAAECRSGNGSDFSVFRRRGGFSSDVTRRSSSCVHALSTGRVGRKGRIVARRVVVRMRIFWEDARAQKQKLQAFRACYGFTAGLCFQK